MVEKQSEVFYTILCHFFPSLKQNFMAYRSSSRLECMIFEIHELWRSGFSRVYSNCCCSCSFEPEIIRISQSSHKMYSNNILNFQESTTILNSCTRKVWKLIECPTYLNIFISQCKLIFVETFNLVLVTINLIRCWIFDYEPLVTGGRVIGIQCCRWAPRVV